MRSRIFTAATAVLTLVGAWNCGGGSGSGTPTGPSSGPTAATITITGNSGSRSFSPNPANLGGQMVVFRNNDSIVHRVRLNDGSLDTGDIAPGATSRAVLMPTAGTNYHCSLHTTMIGAVAANNGEPPVCTGDYC
jgi:plastocyanin